MKAITEDRLKAEFKEIMICLKSERNAKFPIKGKDLAEKLSKTVNYFSAIENGNEFPSMKLFLNYLLICGFDLSPIKSLKINDSNQDGSEINRKRLELITKVQSLDEDQIGFLLEQAKISEIFKLKQK